MRISVRKVAAGFVILIVLVLAGAQLVRPQRAPLLTDPSRTIAASLGAGSELAPVLDRACGDCHSNAPVRAWYTEVAPVSWVMSRGATLGRKAVNFSDWASYSPQERRDLLLASCRDATNGTMPMSAYTRFRPEARLSARDVETICAVANQGPATARSNAP